jgi:hypothetical protein
VQLFARDEIARVARPEKQLVGFARVPLAAGETCTVSFEVDASALAYYDEAMRLVVEPGEVRFSVGDLSISAALIGKERTIEPNDRRPTGVRVER